MHTRFSELLGSKNVTRIDLGAGNLGDDIKSFVVHRVEELAGKKSLSKQLTQKIQTTLIQRAEGMFLWVWLVLYELDKLLSTRDGPILHKLNGIPGDLPGCIQRF